MSGAINRSERTIRAAGYNPAFSNQFRAGTPEKNDHGPSLFPQCPGTDIRAYCLHTRKKNILPMLIFISLLFLCGSAYAVPVYSWHWDSPSTITPSYIAINGTDNHLFVTDVSDDKIIVLGPDGIPTGVEWGTWGIGNGEFKNPQGVALDSTGYVYVVDSLNNRIQKFDASGTYQQEWGTYGSGSGEFNNPAGIAIDNSNRIFVADTLNKRIEVYDGSVWSDFVPPGWGLNNPKGIAVDGSGNVYVADTDNGEIYILDSSGNYIRDIGFGGRPIGVTVDKNNNVYIADSSQDTVLVYDVNNNLVAQLGSYGSGSGEFNNPAGIAVNDSQDIFVADYGNNRIEQFQMTNDITVDFTATPDSGTEPLSVSFIDSSTNLVNPNTWDWDYGDSSPHYISNDPANPNPPDHTYDSSGSPYTVTLKVSDAFGNASTSHTITVNPAGPGMPTSSFSGTPTSGTVPLDVTFTDLSDVVGGTAWNWSFGDGTWFNDTSSSGPVHTYSSTGSFDVALTVTNASGSNTQTQSGYITVNPAGPGMPTSSFSGTPTSGTVPLDVTFTDLSDVVGGTAWNWSFGDGTWFNDTSSSGPVHTYSSTGSFDVALTVTNASGSNTQTQSGYITVNPAGPGMPTSSFSGTPTSGTVPLDVTFTDLSDVVGGTAWNWSFGDGTWYNTTGSSSPMHIYNSPGTYTVSLTVTNASGSDTATHSGYIAVSGTSSSPVSGGSDSGSGGSGGSSSGTATVSGVTAGAPAAFSFTPVVSDASPAGITGVDLVTTENLGTTQAVVSSVPTGTITGPAGQPVAGLMQITVPGLGPAAVDHATITFEVSKDWLSANGLTPADITGAYDNNGVWSSLPTTYTGDNGNVCTFTMTTESLGYFAITVFKNGTVPGLNHGTAPATAATLSYPLGFEGLSYNSDGQGALSINLANAKTAGATVSLYFNRVEVYQHHSPGVTTTFWGNNFALNNGTISGTASRAEFVTDPLNTTLDYGPVTGSVKAVLPALTHSGWVNNTIAENTSADTRDKFTGIARTNGLSLRDVAYTLAVKKNGITTGPANVTFTIPAAWVNSHGGPTEVFITRISEDTGKTELLATTYLGLDPHGNMIFQGDSPNGTSLFGLVTAETTSVAQKQNPNTTYVPASKSAMITDVGMLGWIAGCMENNPVLIALAVAVLALALYFGWWRRRL